jgi:hypothetical protein
VLHPQIATATKIDKNEIATFTGRDIKKNPRHFLNIRGIKSPHHSGVDKLL